MDGFDWVFFAAAVPAVLFAGVSKGGFGNGAGFASTPILALVAPPAVALAVMLPLLMLMDLAAVRAYWRKWDRAAMRALILGAVPGVALGAALYRQTDPDLFRLLIGIMAVAFVVFQVARARGWLTIARAPFSALRCGLAGMAGGFTSFISHAGGPPIAVYLLSQRLDKTRYQGTTVVTFWAINLFKLAPYALLGFFSAATLGASLVLAPVALSGVWLGVWLHTRLPERVFFAFTYVLLLAAGARLIWDALA